MNEQSDFQNIVDRSKENILKSPRKRRTKAELEKDPNFKPKSKIEGQRVGSTETKPQDPLAQAVNQMNQAPPSFDRTKEFTPAFKLYSELFLAKPLNCPEIGLSDAEAEALASVTSNLMNAFPEWFNTSNPKVMAIMGAVVVAVPIGFAKYRIYQSIKPRPQAPQEKQKIEEVKVEVKPQPKQEEFNNPSFFRN